MAINQQCRLLDANLPIKIVGYFPTAPRVIAHYLCP
jgi:hypothetical protein